MSLVLKYNNFINKIISEIKEDICKKITQDASVCNNIVDLILEYSDEYDTTVEFDICYKTRRSFSHYHLVVLNGDLKMIESKLFDNWDEYDQSSEELSKYNSIVKAIEEAESREIHIWMGASEKVEFHKIKSISKQIVTRIEKMYPEMNPKIDMKDSPSLAGEGEDLAIVLKI